MVRVRAVVEDWVGGVNLDGKDTGAHNTGEDVIAARRLARLVEGTLGNRVPTTEVEFNEVTLSSSQAVWGKGVSWSDTDGVDFGEDAGKESHWGNKVSELNHLDIDIHVCKDSEKE